MLAGPRFVVSIERSQFPDARVRCRKRGKRPVCSVASAIRERSNVARQVSGQFACRQTRGRSFAIDDRRIVVVGSLSCVVDGWCELKRATIIRPDSRTNPHSRSECAPWPSASIHSLMSRARSCLPAPNIQRGFHDSVQEPPACQ
jgi:hypothetical protein